MISEPLARMEVVSWVVGRIDLSLRMVYMMIMRGGVGGNGRFAMHVYVCVDVYMLSMYGWTRRRTMIMNFYIYTCKINETNTPWPDYLSTPSSPSPFRIPTPSTPLHLSTPFGRIRVVW